MKSITSIVGSALVAFAALLGACGDTDDAEDTRINELQMIGTHNSYHVQMPAQILDAIAQFDESFARSAEYTHVPLERQLDAGIRQLELDVYADPAGGRFASRAVLAAFGLPTASGIAELSRPGFKVLHVPEVDYGSTCWTLKVCLQAIRGWSESNPRHIPLVIFIEPKDDPVPDPLGLGFAQPLKIGRLELAALEEEVLAVFPRDRLITPDDVRGKSATLEEAVLTRGWPTLGQSRGKLIFALVDDGGEKRDAYRVSDPSLRGRLLFTMPGPGEPDAAIIKLDDPIQDFERIGDLVRKGYIVRTRADADTIEARNGQTARRDAALRSGAQLISTDYAVEPARFGTGYVVELSAGEKVACNRVTAPASCRSAGLGASAPR